MVRDSPPPLYLFLLIHLFFSHSCFFDKQNIVFKFLPKRRNLTENDSVYFIIITFIFKF
jgi:hypothetical protein